jgi:hypothetical protein
MKVRSHVVGSSGASDINGACMGITSTNYTAYTVMWSPSYTLLNFHFVGIAVTKELDNFRRLGGSRRGGYPRRASARYVDQRPLPVPPHRDIRRMDPGMQASPWLPNGTHIEYAFTRATALFEPVEDIDVRRDVKWYVFTFHYNDIWWLKPVGVRYGQQITVAKSDDRPVFDFSCLKYVKTVTTSKAPGGRSTTPHAQATPPLCTLSTYTSCTRGLERRSCASSLSRPMQAAYVARRKALAQRSSTTAARRRGPLETSLRWCRPGIKNRAAWTST